MHARMHACHLALQVDGEPLSPPKPLPWYPNNYGWHMDFSRGQLRKMPLLEQIHGFIKVRLDDLCTIYTMSVPEPMLLNMPIKHVCIYMKTLRSCVAMPGRLSYAVLSGLFVLALYRHVQICSIYCSVPCAFSVPMRQVASAGRRA